MTEAQALREAILAAPLETSNFGETPRPGTLYLPPSHLKALRLDAHVVVGSRGVGKSFWTAALQSAELRGLLGTAASELAGIEVHAGFANREAIADYPNTDVFSVFLDQGGDPYDLWRAVVLRWVAERAGQSIPSESWAATTAWLRSDPEAAARLMQHPRDWRGLILFDALDRTSNVWQRMDDIVRGLLRAVLWLKTFPGLHAKVFLREDQAERTVFNFPDASKLTATKAELTWARHDLHGLLWQRLVNAPDRHGQRLRGICRAREDSGIWLLPDDMKRETDTQRSAFGRLAGPWMGRDRRRGVPYTWSVSHLADGRGQTSPRSFLAAIHQAAEDSGERYPQHDYALHYESLKRGIQKASEIRVTEVAEDYPWVPEVLSELKGMNVPCVYEEMLARWCERFPGGPQDIHLDRLPAQHATRGWEGIREDLQRLGLIETKKDGRIDMPDLYRVGFGLGRKGGVKPRNRGS
ncbi:hypothetical protein [Allochromatium tepidum]|uniref:ATP-binding protein n=1 Tax=Allochromatium tepidum TaxID=553982 RepID=A0ABM7QI56_9GAMM|nr:hypothetical protein [Allochromatium tepidum]BCU05421.1 hypothetical protein Atep_00980 [Allochromatium tepidum]